MIFCWAKRVAAMATEMAERKHLRPSHSCLAVKADGGPAPFSLLLSRARLGLGCKATRAMPLRVVLQDLAWPQGSDAACHI